MNKYKDSQGLAPERIQRLKELLPHGSGINGNWSIERARSKSNVFFASNTYDAMNECGMYCHYYDFTLTIQYNGAGKHTPCKYCDKGMQYMPEFPFQRSCVVCMGLGYTILPEYEILRLNFHGQASTLVVAMD